MQNADVVLCSVVWWVICLRVTVEPLDGYTIIVCDARPVRRQTYGYVHTLAYHTLQLIISLLFPP